ncbi:MAG: phosphopantetheine-binding protein, partial [Planctomycetota bacterium]
PDGAVGAQRTYVAAESAEEMLLAEIWSDVLGVDTVGVNDNFFSLGGHSLLVMKVIARVEEQTGIRLSPQDFLMGSLEQLAAQLPSDETLLEEPPATDTAHGLLAALRGFWN